MRTRLPAALFLLLSWFLPATAHAHAVEHLSAQAAATWRAQQQPGRGQASAAFQARQRPGPVAATGRTQRPPAATWQTRQHRPPGLGQEPYRHALAQARHALLGFAGPAWPAVLPGGPPSPTAAWAAVAARPGPDAPAGLRPAAASARAPPSTRFSIFREPRTNTAATAA